MESQQAEQEWQCPVCTLVNSYTSLLCDACGHQHGVAQPPISTKVQQVEQELWQCPKCTLTNPATLSCCDACGHQIDVASNSGVTPVAVSSTTGNDEDLLRAAISMIANAAALKTLSMLVSNAKDNPHEPKFRGPIRKGNSRIREAIVEVVGAADVLKLAGFQEEPELFMLPNVDVDRLSRVYGFLQERLAAISRIESSSSKAQPFTPAPRAFTRKKEIEAESQVAPVVSNAEPTVLRLRLRLPVSGGLEFHVPVDTTVIDFQTLLSERTGIPTVHQRFRFGFPPKKLDADGDARLLDAGFHDGEKVILEDLHELFLTDLDTKRYTMAELIERLPPDADESQSTEALFKETLQALGIALGDKDFWGPVKRQVQSLVAGQARGSAQRSDIRSGLLLLQRLFRTHDPEQRLSLIVNCLPIPSSARQATRLNRAAPRGATELTVDRAAFFPSVSSQILKLSQQQLLAPLVVQYKGEKGLDWGGLTRDFFSSFATRLGEDETSLWRITGRGSLHPTADVVSAKAKYPSGGWTSHKADALYRASGRVFGMAVLHGCKLGRQLSRPFIRLLVGSPAQTLQELQDELNYEAGESEADFRGKTEMIEKPLAEMGLEGILSFTRTIDGHPDIGEIPLVPNGAKLPVTDENKVVWLNTVLKHELVTSIEFAATAFRSGLIDVFGGSGDVCALLCLLDVADLVELWGSGGVSREQVASWRRVTRVSRVVQRQAQWFFQVLEEDYDDEMRGKVLQFTTGASSIGREGLRTFIIEPADGGDDRLPSAMTCGNMIQLPRYSCRAVLAAQLRTAAEMCSSFALL